MSGYLGRLVEKELRRRAGRQVAGISLDQPEPEQALGALVEVRASIDAIAGRLARSEISHGASWGDVGRSLRLSGDAAQAAYEGLMKVSRRHDVRAPLRSQLRGRLSSH